MEMSFLKDTMKSKSSHPIKQIAIKDSKESIKFYAQLIKEHNEESI